MPKEQKQFTTYQADILSFSLREALLGVVNPGRYSGYFTIASNGLPSGGIIPFKILQTLGVEKLPKGGSAFGYPTGVAVTTQGTIIHEERDVELSMDDNSGGGDIRYDLVYMEHDYIEVAGVNPATYGIIKGTVGAGVPALTEDYHRIIIGVLKINIGATDTSGVVYIPTPAEKGFGDTKMVEKLWGDNTDLIFGPGQYGTIPSDGIVGTRNFSSNQYITDFDSITKALSDLDSSLLTEETARIAIGNRALDDASWGALSDNTNHNASISSHGLLKKLPNDASQFLNGIGNWAIPLGRALVWRDAIVVTDFAKADFGNFAATSGFLDFTTLVPSDCELVMIRINIDSYPSVTNEINLSFRKGTSIGAAQSAILPATGATESTRIQESMLIGLHSDKTILWTTNVVAQSDIMLARVVLVAYQTAI